MSLPMGAMERTYARSVKAEASKSKRAYKFLFIAWAFLIACGIWGTKAYSDYLRDQITTRISEENKLQLDLIRMDYQAQLSDLKITMQSDIAALQTKVDSLADLMAFSKDSANSNMDDSNQLYTQLTEVKLQLEALERALDVLR